MDYVLFGMGYGASLMLLGWALRTFGPQLKYAKSPDEDDRNFLVQQRFWVRFVQGLGGVIAIAGTTMVLLIFVVVLMNPADDTGATIAMAIWGFILAVVLIWCGLYLSRFGLTGIWSRDAGYGFNRKSTSDSPVRTSRDFPTVAESVPTVAQSRITIENSSVESASDDGEDAGQIQEVASETAEPEEEIPEPAAIEVEPAADPAYDFGDGSETTVPSEAGGRSEALRRLRQRQGRSGA